MITNSTQDSVAALHTASRPAGNQKVTSVADSNKSKITFIALNTVLVRTASSRSSTYARMDPGSKYFDPTFPKQVRVSANRVAWIESEIDAWLESRINASRATSTSALDRSGNKTS